jgi:hypothetical protein
VSNSQPELCQRWLIASMSLLWTPRSREGNWQLSWRRYYGSEPAVESDERTVIGTTIAQCFESAVRLEEQNDENEPEHAR